jgi:hypothetical protein
MNEVSVQLESERVIRLEFTHGLVPRARGQLRDVLRAEGFRITHDSEGQDDIAEWLDMPHVYMGTHDDSDVEDLEGRDRRLTAERGLTFLAQDNAISEALLRDLRALLGLNRSRLGITKILATVAATDDLPEQQFELHAEGSAEGSDADLNLVVVPSIAISK